MFGLEDVKVYEDIKTTGMPTMDEEWIPFTFYLQSLPMLTRPGRMRQQIYDMQDWDMLANTS